MALPLSRTTVILGVVGQKDAVGQVTGKDDLQKSLRRIKRGRSKPLRLPWLGVEAASIVKETATITDAGELMVEVEW